MIYWAPLLHFYQPPTQIHWVLDKICDECYRPLLKIFQEIPSARVTVNINAVLTELLHDHGKKDIIDSFRELAARGQVEFTGSGKYHPILPLIPRDEMERQITLNMETNRQLLGPIFSPRGFFPPEMAYSKKVVEPILKTGHEWIILGGVACPAEWPMDVIHEISMDGKKSLAVLFRDDILSNKISFLGIQARNFLDHLTSLRGNRKDIYVVTAMDAETFGHHIKNWEKLFLGEVFEALRALEETGKGIRKLQDMVRQQSVSLSANDIKVVTISELLNLFPRGNFVEPRDSSWSTTGADVEACNCFPLWEDPGNQIHQLQWEHTNIAIDMVQQAMKRADNDGSKVHAALSRELLDRALHSDQFWWAARKPMWDINLVNRGLMQQSEAILNAFKAIMMSSATSHEKLDYRYREIAARDIRGKIRDLLFRG